MNGTFKLDNPIGCCPICGEAKYETHVMHQGYCVHIQKLIEDQAAIRERLALLTAIVKEATDEILDRVTKLEARLNAAPNGVRFS